MKKITSLQVLMLMSLALGSTTTQARNAQDKTVDSKKSHADCDTSRAMKSIEKDLYTIQKEFRKSRNAQAAQEKLDSMPARIKEVVAQMKSHEVHGKMWEVHEHTLNRKLKEAQAQVSAPERSHSKPAKANAESAQQPSMMKAIERDLHRIKKQFNESHDAQVAQEKLDAMPARIKEAVAQMKSHEVHGKMWEVHEHTLNRKLKEVREVVSHVAKK